MGHAVPAGIQVGQVLLQIGVTRGFDSTVHSALLVVK